MSTLVGAGLRETEVLMLEPEMLHFDEYPVRIKIPPRIAKFQIGRETFLSPVNSKRVQQLIKTKNIVSGQTIFVKNFTKYSLKDFEDQFSIIRTKCNLDTPNRKKYQQNDITLHSLRSYFTTFVTDEINDSTANALTGHSKYMKTYYRKPLEKRQTEFALIMKGWSSDDHDIIAKISDAGWTAIHLQ
ncbi:MAG: tyrosine-type recombinase/integrase [Nitrosopumilus sp.]|nr:MAG: tyrosine-type recombinase/integrase [Nitrosopumilus sp.]